METALLVIAWMIVVAVGFWALSWVVAATVMIMLGIGDALKSRGPKAERRDLRRPIEEDLPCQ